MKVIQDYYKQNDINLQFTPTHVHRSNDEERFIRTWKDNLLSGISGVKSQFPMYLWDRLIPQDNITLNLLREYRVNSILSDYEELEGKFNYNKTPLFPPG